MRRMGFVVDGLPPELTEEERWLPRIGEKHAPTGWNNPENWKALDDIPEGQEPIFNMCGTDFLIIDGDHIAPAGKLYPEARDILQKIMDGLPTYAEWSQSGTGLHIVYDLSEYRDEFQQMTGSGYYNLSLKCADDAHIEFYYSTSHLFRFTGMRGKNSTDRVTGGEDAAEAARRIMKLLEEHNGCKPSHSKSTNGEALPERIPEGQRHYFIVQRCGELVNRLGDRASTSAVLAMVESDLFEYCENPDNVDLKDFRKKYRKTIEKFQANRQQNSEDPNFWGYALKAWKKENPGQQFDPAVTTWDEVRECGERAKASGWEPDSWKAEQPEKKAAPGKPVPALTFVNAAELARSKLPEIYYPIEELIPEGETILAAPPKSGKSWMVLQMALAVAEGRDFLDFKTNKSDVVYFALEDGDKFEQDRLLKLCSADRVPDNFHFVFQNVVPLDEGFTDQLEQVRSAFPGVRLVIIDTLRFVACSQRGKESAYERDYRTGQMLKAWADKYGIAVLVVTHTTKLVRPEDALANVSGTNGVTGAADAVLVIAKDKRTDTSAVLAVDGRRVKQTEHEIRIDWEKCCWEYVGLADPDERERRQRERQLDKLRSSTAYKAALVLSDKYTEGWQGGARKFINDAAEHGVFITESAKEVGGMLTNNIPQLAQDGVRVQVLKNGTGANTYRLSQWRVLP